MAKRLGEQMGDWKRGVASWKAGENWYQEAKKQGMMHSLGCRFSENNGTSACTCGVQALQMKEGQPDDQA